MTSSGFVKLVIAIYVSVVTLVSRSDQCNVQLPDLIHVKETDLPGTEIFNVGSLPGITWTFDLDISKQHLLKSYFNFTRNVARQQFVMRLARTLDIEDIKRSLTTPTDRILLKLINWSRDDDVNLSEREIYEFTLSANDGTSDQRDAGDWLYMSNTYDGAITLKKSLDYESLPANRKYLSTGVVVKDVGGLSGSSTLILQVIDEDDLPPVFHFPGCVTPCTTTYSAEVSFNTTGVITDIAPGPIKATDGDALSYGITYHINQGSKKPATD
ncbi:hypothetical protein Btru_067560 [Bulinus truncatus]|nr:hypothetical protein Btru_067560 [Bulinus truncatus]